jgi:predicted subunit of tRNA(5-methylaminomethyl-2-thiouridylate) methyltransferase
MDRVVTDLEHDGYKVDRGFIEYAMTVMIENHSAEYGINWETLTEYALEYCVVEDEE